MVWRTTAVTVTTCFLLGTTFTHWIADHDVLWHSPLTSEALADSIGYYALIASANPILGYAYVGILAIALISTASRTFSALTSHKGEVLFDGASLVLLSGIAYQQLNDAYPTLLLFPDPLPAKLEAHPLYPALVTASRDLANDNVITAVMLTGIMLLQAGRYYSKRPSRPEDIDAEPSSGASSPPSSPPNEPVDASPALHKRAATPYRELTEEEAFELHG